jgi:protocatechuate 3,4-dioxygenase beta subunit
MRWRLLVAAIVALAVLVAVFLSSERPTAPDERGPRGTEAAASASPVEVERRERAESEKPADAPPPSAAVPATTATVEVVVLAEGAPVAGATVELHEGALPPSPRATSGADGVARFTDVPPGNLDLLVRQDGFVRHDESDLLYKLAAGETRRVEVRLVPGVAVRGIVVDAATGAPLVGARLVCIEGGRDGEGCSSSGSSDVPLGETATNADGRFEFPHLPPQMLVTVSVRADGHARAERGFTIPTPGGEVKSLEFRLPAELVLRGEVTDPDGLPLAGAKVAVETDAEREPRETTTDARGAFAVGELRPGVVYSASASAEGFAPSEAAHDLRSAADAREIRHDFRLRRFSGIRLHVTDDAGAGVGGAKVECWGDGYDRSDLVTAADGTLAVEKLTPGKAGVRVKAEGRPLAVVDVAVPEGATPSVEVRLDAGVAIEGVVVDDLGAPVRAGVVEASRSYGPEGEGLPESEGKTKCDAGGRFRVDGLLPGAHQLIASATDCVACYVRSIQAPSTGVRVVLPRYAKIRARVRVAEGAPAPAQLETRFVFDEPQYDFVSAGGGTSEPWSGAKTVEFLVGPRPGRLAVVATGLARDVRRIAPAPGETVDLGEILLGAGIDVTGRVVDAQGQPVAGAEVSEGETFSTDFQKVVTTGDGAFVLHHMALGECALSLRAKGRVSRDLVVTLGAGSGTLVLPLPRGGRLRGSVVDADGGPVTKGWVRVFDPAVPEKDLDDGHQDYPHLDADGLFETRLVAGRYRLEVHRDSPDVAATAEAELAEGEERAVTVKLPR